MLTKLIYSSFDYKYQQEFLISADLISSPLVGSTIWVSTLNTGTGMYIYFSCWFFLSKNNILVNIR